MIVQEALCDPGKDSPVVGLRLGLEEGVLVGLGSRNALIEILGQQSHQEVFR